MQVDIVLPGETVYQSGVIPAGCQVSEGLLNRPLPKGKYPATALLHILDPMDGEILGELEQPGNPLHRYKWIKKASSGAFPEGCFFCARF